MGFYVLAGRELAKKSEIAHVCCLNVQFMVSLAQRLKKKKNRNKLNANIS